MPETKVDWPKLLDEALTAPGNMGNVYSRFHDYSITNMMLFMLRGIHEPVASYSRWKSLGRQVVKGAKAKEVIVPVLVNDPRDAHVQDTPPRRKRAFQKRCATSYEQESREECRAFEWRWLSWNVGSSVGANRMRSSEGVPACGQHHAPPDHR